MKTEILRTRVDPDKLRQAEAVLSLLGITTGEAINIFLNQVVIQRRLPFPVTTERHLSLNNAALEEIDLRYQDRIPNDESLSALNEDLGKAKRHKSGKSLLDSLKS
ncbi:MAG: type II toxin-antitoxin system RelB/DinJ family antitoxin [Verrucomicrobiota bacterium]|nr:type II toxin-antitoxin system RelB/DinJ family antitoxin [Verrucomicrobiota bacterium]